MSLVIHPIKLGVARCYVIQAEGTILIDGGAPKQAGSFLKGIASLSINPKDILLIVITLTLHKICNSYFLFFMLPPEAHRGSAADLVELHDLRSL